MQSEKNKRERSLLSLASRSDGGYKESESAFSGARSHDAGNLVRAGAHAAGFSRGWLTVTGTQRQNLHDNEGGRAALKGTREKLLLELLLLGLIKY